jgi:hypothetical protein
MAGYPGISIRKLDPGTYQLSQQYEEKLRELGLCTLEERRHQLDMTQTFKILKGVDKVNKSTWFTPASERTSESDKNGSRSHECQAAGL